MDNKARILILEDDEALASVLKIALEEAGYSVDHVECPEKALKKIQENTYQMLLSDVLLSGMTGVDLALKVRNEIKNTQIDIAFMSGVFKDKYFIREAISSVKACFYLQKPFAPEDLIKRLDRHYRVMGGEDFQGQSSRQIINDILYKSKNNPVQIRRSVGALREIHGFEFPMLLSLLIETCSTGELTLKQSSGLESQISMSEGKIISVSTNRQDSLLGNLLIEMGYLKADDLNRVLGDPEVDQSEKLGVKLIKANVISPHSFLLALEYQIILRLSRWVVSKNIEFRFIPVDVKLEKLHIDSDQLTSYLHDWVMSTIHPEWLESFYRHFEGASLIKGSRFQLGHEIFRKPLFKNNQILQKTLLESRKYKDLFKVDTVSSEDILRGLYLLVSKRLISFSKDHIEDCSEEELIENLQNIQRELSGKNAFEQFKYLGIGLGSESSQIRMVFEEFIENLPLSQDAQSKSFVARDEIISSLEESMEYVSSPERRKEYEEKIQKDTLKLRIKVHDRMEEAKANLQNNKGREALEILKEVNVIHPDAEELKEYIVWAKLCMINTQNREEIIKNIDKSMSTIPPGNRQSFLYMYLEGMLAMHKGNSSLAQNKLEEVLRKSPSMVEAKRALNIIRLKKKQKVKNDDFLNRDLGAVMKSWLKGKKSA